MRSIALVERNLKELVRDPLMTIFSIENVVLMYTADVLLSVGIGLICSRIEKRI